MSPADKLTMSRCKSTLGISEQVLKITLFNVLGKTQTRLRWREKIFFENRFLPVMIQLLFLVQWDEWEWGGIIIFECTLPLTFWVSSHAELALVAWQLWKEFSWCLPVAGHTEERAFWQQRSSLLYCSGSLKSWILVIVFHHFRIDFFFFASSNNSPHAKGNVLFKLICLLVFRKTQYPAIWKTQKCLLCYFALSLGVWHF